MCFDSRCLSQENQLYYDPSTGIYYYCDVDSGRYQFHSRVDLQPYQNPPTRQSKDKKWKKRRKGPDGSAASGEKVMFRSLKFTSTVGGDMRKQHSVNLEGIPLP